MIKNTGKPLFLDLTDEELEKLWNQDTSGRISYSVYVSRYYHWFAEDFDANSKTIYVHKNKAIDIITDNSKYTSPVKKCSSGSIWFRPYRKGDIK